VSNIVSLKGEEITPLGEPVPEVVERVEDILERAQSGNVRGLLIVELCADETCNSYYAGEINNRMMGTFERLKYRVFKALDDE